MSELTRSEILSNPRWAGEVERYHTWPINRRQSVGEHTWQVMRIYWQIYGPMPPVVSTAILWHDAGELGTGDIPFPVKRNDPLLKLKFDDLEARVLISMGVVTTSDFEIPDDGEALRIDLCDLIEMWEFGLAEVARGNQMAHPIVNDVMKAVGEKLEAMSDKDAALAYRYINKRLP